jgi:hypothetical protein
VANTIFTPEAIPAGTVAGYHSPAPIDLSVGKAMKITPKERKMRRETGLCMYCGDSRHFAACCPRKLKAVSGQVEINLFNKDLRKGKDKEEDSGII